jgi:hypothetical protein
VIVNFFPPPACKNFLAKPSEGGAGKKGFGETPRRSRSATLRGKNSRPARAEKFSALPSRQRREQSKFKVRPRRKSFGFLRGKIFVKKVRILFRTDSKIVRFELIIFRRNYIFLFGASARSPACCKNRRLRRWKQNISARGQKISGETKTPKTPPFFAREPTGFLPAGGGEAPPAKFHFFFRFLFFDLWIRFGKIIEKV